MSDLVLLHGIGTGPEAWAPQVDAFSRRRTRQQPASVSEALRRQDGSANAGRSRSTPPLELEPFTDEWLAWYEARRLFSSIDMLNDNDARRGIVPPREARARERRRGSSGR